MQKTRQGKAESRESCAGYCGSVFRRAFHCRLRRSLLPPRSCFQLFPKREGFGQTVTCSHNGMETRGGALAERGSEWRSVRTAPAAVGARQELRRGRSQRPWPGGCPSAAASRVLAPGSSGDAPTARRKGSQSPGRGERGLSPEKMTPPFQKPCLISCLGFIAPLAFRSPCPPHTSNKPGSSALPALPAPPRTLRARPAVAARPAAEQRGPHAWSRESFAPFTDGWQFLAFPPRRSLFESELLLKRHTTCSVLPASGEGGTKAGDGKKSFGCRHRREIKINNLFSQEVPDSGSLWEDGLKRVVSTHRAWAKRVCNPPVSRCARLETRILPSFS